MLNNEKDFVGEFRSYDWEKMALQEADYHSNMNILFLRDLVEGINLSFRYHGDKNKDELLRILRRKLSPEKMGTVFRMYLACYDVEAIVQKIRPKGMSELVEAVESFFDVPEYLHEVTVGSRRCDLVFFSGIDVNAIEVKSSLDKLSYAPEQLGYYGEWANRVYLAYDIKHRKKVENLAPPESGIGLLQFSEGRIKLVYEASFQKQDEAEVLSFLTYNYLRKVARKFGVDLRGGKKAISQRLSQKVTRDEAKNIFRDFLRTRALI